HHVTILSNRSMPANTSMPAPHGTGWRWCNGSTGAAVCRCGTPANTTTDTAVLSDARALLLPADPAASLPAGVTFAGLPDSVDARIDRMWMGATAWRTWTGGWRRYRLTTRDTRAKT